MRTISLTINEKPVTATVEPRTHLADFLREGRNLTGTHIGCEHGVCGACTVLIDGSPARSCITFAVACDGASITTIEGLDNDPVAAELRTAFSREHALQCGYCTPGMLISARDVALRLDRSFVTPLDREDIYRLTQELDTVVDLIDGTARRATMFRIRESRPYAEQLAAVLEQAIEALQRSVQEVKDRRAVAKHALDVKRLEEQGDLLYSDAIRDLFDTTKDAIEVIKWKEVYDGLEDACDECKDYTHVIGNIVSKNA